MLYLLNVETTNTDRLNYYTFETHTESPIIADYECMMKLINECKMAPKNMYVNSKGIQFNEWPHDVSDSYYKNHVFILLAKLSERRFKCIRGIDREVFYMDDKQLKGHLDYNHVLNCSCENGVYKSIDTYNIVIDPEFEKSIAKKYETFIAKSIMLGLDMSFEYIIENEEVKIICYTGKSRRVIVPNFITTITKDAFKTTNLQEVRLSEGLRYIGVGAFKNNNIDRIVIPKTVEFVAYDAFGRNPKLLGSDGGYNDAVKKLGSKTVILV